MYIGVVSWREEDPRRQTNFTLSLQGEISIHVVPRAIAKIAGHLQIVGGELYS